jgi:hypothetical protein
VSPFDQPQDVEKSGAFIPVRALRLVFDTAALDYQWNCLNRLTGQRAISDLNRHPC